VEKIKLWEKLELGFSAENNYENPYMDVDIWVKLTGPGFQEKVYGFWNGGNEFAVRVTATAPGEWSWESFCNQDDPGLTGKTGTFHAYEWTPEEKRENLTRRGFIRNTPNNRAFMHDDGTPFYYIADTWWAVPTFRFPWYDDEPPRLIGPGTGFKEMVKYRKRQGYNGIALLAGHPMWADDGYPKTFFLDDEERTPVRAAWSATGKLPVPESAKSSKAKEMHNQGGRPFRFPGPVKGYEDLIPDLTRINPEYFKHMDKKVDYLNKAGFIPFIETARRDVSRVWKKYFPWPESYARYILYIFTRYQANNVMLSPIHFDGYHMSLAPREFNEPANIIAEKYNAPAFGQPVSANPASSTWLNFGEEGRWLTFHQIGNNRRTHDSYWYLTQIFREDPKPAMNGEPYYPGYPDDKPEAPGETAEAYSRAALYGSFLSGGLAGHIYGVEGLWGGDIHENAKYKIWEGLEFRSGAQIPYIKNFFAFLNGRYVDLIPESELIIPNKTGVTYGLTGWAYCARTEDKRTFLGYFESRYNCSEGVVNEKSGKIFKSTDSPRIRGLLYIRKYRFRWFNPRNGEWLDDQIILESNHLGECLLPELPGDEDWGFRLEVME
jgi:hypothetical protein